MPVFYVHECAVCAWACVTAVASPGDQLSVLTLKFSEQCGADTTQPSESVEGSRSSE